MSEDISSDKKEIPQRECKTAELGSEKQVSSL